MGNFQHVSENVNTEAFILVMIFSRMQDEIVVLTVQ
jgi:hypothetical protein